MTNAGAVWLRPRVVWIDFMVHMKTWTRSKASMFWSILFPVLLMVLFGGIFGGMFETKLTLHIQDLDGTGASELLVDSLGQALDVEVVDRKENTHDYISEKGLRAVMVIPAGFGEVMESTMSGGQGTVSLALYLDPSQQSVNAALRSVVSGITGHLNQQIIQTNYPGAHQTIALEEKAITAKEFKFIDFFLPGVIGITILSSTIYGTIFRNTKYKEDGILRKLTTTPMRRSEWLFAMMLFMTFTSLLSTGIIILVGVLTFGIRISLNPLFLVIIISASFAFAGMGMIISRFVHEEETADTAGGAVTFPMMFLAGTFFPLESLPPSLRVIARLLPLYYVNEGLRDTMIFDDIAGGLANAAIVLGIATVFFILGVLLTKWKE